MSARSYQFVAAIVAVLASAGGTAAAEGRGIFRIGVEPLSLTPSVDTPFVGEHVNDAITAYNTASSAYNSAHGFAPGSAMAVAPIDSSALSLNATLVTFAPGFELGGEHVAFRIEGLVGLSDHVRAIGLGLYPIDVQLPLRGSNVTPYVVAGGTLRWLDRSDLDGETGGLATVRAAAGTRIGRHFAVELGVGLFMLGGLYNGSELRSMSSYNPRGMAPPPAPDRVVSGGTQTGMIDVSVGFVL